jgi:NAD(P)-dependent dehydrogenase (short-subunit alcohol dehydrogenase family)
VDLQLAGKRAVVTGGGRGLGRAVARSLAVEGAAVAIVSRTAETLQQAAAELSAETGGRVTAVSGDTTDDTSVREMAHRVAEELGGIDILINGAALQGSGQAPPKLSEISEENFWADVNVKVLGYIRTIREVTPYMVEAGGGRIVNLSGMNAFFTGSTIGSIRNVAVSALTKIAADELAPYRISVIAVHPWYTRAGGAAATLKARAEREGVTVAEVERQMGKRSLIGRLLDADEIAACVVFLASPRAVAVNGDAVMLSGGVAGHIHY